MDADCRTLIIRHLPSELSEDDKEELLKYFGAEQVRCFSQNGHMKHVAFALFEDHEAAKAALHRLHQMKVLDSVLSVEFSKSHLSHLEPSQLGPIPLKGNESDKFSEEREHEEKIKKRKKEIIKEINNISSKWGVEYSYNPKLQYAYPHPTVSILTNIANALASVPRFYVQVLHLMNKMNLPAPFGQVTPTPPIPEGEPLSQTPPPLPPSEPMQESSSEPESELESEDDGGKQKTNPSTKRPATDVPKTWSKQKLQKLIHVPRAEVVSNPIRPEDMFEKPQSALQKKIELRLPDSISQSLEVQRIQKVHETMDLQQVLERDHQDVRGDIPSATEQEPGPVEGFGKMAPVPVVREESSSEEENEEWGETKFISSRKLRKGRLSRSEIRELSVFKNYESGEPTTRLYIKNLSKQATEKDLHYVFGRYVKWEDESEKLMFDIRLMKEGRMKGQAFITLPNIECAKDALEDTNAFVLKDKPMVVQFARSAKAKVSEKPKS